MKISGCSFSELSYSTLFNIYLTNFDKLKSFYEYNPLNEGEIEKRAKSIKSAAYKDAYVSALKAYHRELGIADAQQKQLQKFEKKDSLAVVTGQQLGVFGGPLFTVFKTMTTILLARKYEQKLNRPVVPVFWLGDEDHDFEEISWAGITGREDYQKISLDQENNNLPVSEIVLGEEIESFKEKVKKELYETDFSDALWAQLNKHYQQGKTHAQAFSGLINEWFSEEGLLIAGSNFPSIKKLLAKDFNRTISHASEIYDAVEEKSAEIEESFHRQVMNGDSNLFYISKNGRIKIHKENGNWHAGQIKWEEQELLDEIEKSPEKFSPNVFMRPIIQDKLLPTLGYVAGPGEMAYYGQMKKLYEIFDLEIPPIIPRFCATLIESGITRIVEKLPFKFCEYGKRIEDLESEFIERTETTDLEKVFSQWKQKLDEAAESPLQVINEIDPTLEGTVGKTVAGFSNELEKLKGKVYRSIKNQEKIQLNRIEKIKVNLFPDEGMQERAVSPVYFMNKYGLNIWSELLEEIEKDGLDLTKHHLIEL